MSALHDLTAREQRDALRAGEVDPVELVEHYLARIDKHDHELGAFVHVTRELALDEARAARQRLREGERAPVLGVPIAFKDLQPVAGVPITLGSRAFSAVPPVDGPVVGLLRRAGATTLGTTHAPELGPTCFTRSEVVGRPAVTPYDTSRYASGSSGGAAAAVAAGLVPWAHGSDGAGSIRTPAAVCGLVGLKPSRGRLASGPGASFVSWSSEGVLTRTVEDAALALGLVAHPWDGDLYRLPREGLDGALEQEPRPLRVLCFTDSGLDAPHPEVVRAVEDAAVLLGRLGHDVRHAANPVPWDEGLTAQLTVVYTAAVAAGGRRLGAGGKEHLLAPYTRWCMETSAAHDAVGFMDAQTGVASAAARSLAAVAGYDVVLSPVTAAPAVPVGWFEEDGVGEACADRMLRWSAYTPFANFTGQPAISLPLHVTPEGLPVGVQLTGARVGDDALLLQLAAQVERATPFSHRHPPQW